MTDKRHTTIKRTTIDPDLDPRTLWETEDTKVMFEDLSGWEQSITSKYHLLSCGHFKTAAFKCGYCGENFCSLCMDQGRIGYCEEPGCGKTLCLKHKRISPDHKIYCPDHEQTVDYEKIKNYSGQVFLVFVFIIFLFILFSM